jgi:hypothetical protein
MLAFDVLGDPGGKTASRGSQAATRSASMTSAAEVLMPVAMYA